MSCHPADFFLLRTPLLPFDRWQSWTTCGSAGDEASLRKGLRDALTPALIEALYLASPDLYRGLQGWLEDSESRRSRSVESAIVAYFSRGTDRATPFGLLAGISSGVIARHSMLLLPAQSHYRKEVRLDLRYLDALINELDSEADAVYRLNSTIFRKNGKIRYFEAHVDETTGFRNFRLMECEVNRALEIALEEAGRGASQNAITGRLADDGKNLAGAQKFFAQLLDAQLLVADSPMEVSGEDVSRQLLRSLPSLAATQRALSALEANELGSDVTDYRLVESQLPPLRTTYKGPRFFVDLLKPAEMLAIGQNAVDQVRSGVELLRKIARPEPDRLAWFRQAFAERYGSSEVPLLEALDEESGIQLSRYRQNLGTDITKGIFRTAVPESADWTSYEEKLLQIIAPTLGADKQGLELHPHDLTALASETPPDFPNLFAVNARFFADSPEELDSGNFEFTTLAYLAGPALMGRFASIDEQLQARLRGWIQSEVNARPDCVFAELLHIPPGEPLNQIICRPRFYDYQIPVLAMCSAPEECRIALSDLRVSIQGDRVLLTSERLDREVIPRLPVAHNFRKGTNLQVYRFLCELQYQGSTAAAMWVWPTAMQQLPFLPRLTHGRLILSFARWRIGRAEIERLCAAPDLELMAAVSLWRTSRRIPRFVRLFESDCHIPIDFENILSVRCLIRSIRRSAFAFVEEMYGQDALCVRSPAGRFQHEATIPFAAESTARKSIDVPSSRGLHVFSPGSAWVYLKIYASPAQTDALLAAEIPRLLLSVRSNRLLNRCFFIRYADPEQHLRLRLKAQSGCERELLLTVQEHIRSWITDGFCWRIQFDTYLPEVQRYGGPAAIELAEEVFCADSDAVLGLIRRKKEPRWLLAMLGIDALLNDFGLGFDERLAWSKEVRGAFQQEFSQSAERTKVGVQHRLHRATIRQAFAGENLFASRSECISQIVQRLAAMGCATHQHIVHYTHMHVNRVMPTNQRQNEFVLYDFLCRWYAEKMATGME